MLALVAILHLLEVSTALLNLFWNAFWLIIATVDLCMQGMMSLRLPILCIPKTLFHATAPPASKSRPPRILYTPAFPLHVLIYHTFRRQLKPKGQALLLRGSRFASLADSVIDNEPLHVIRTLGLVLPPRKRMEYLKTLPTLMVTPPEDGDRKPERGEKGAERVRVQKGLLAPPRRVSRAGKMLKEAGRRS